MSKLTCLLQSQQETSEIIKDPESILVIRWVKNLLSQKNWLPGKIEPALLRRESTTFGCLHNKRFPSKS